MAGALSRVAKERAEKEAAAQAEADEKARLDAAAASKAEEKPDDEDDKDKPDGKAKGKGKGAGKKTEPAAEEPDDEDEEDKDKMDKAAKARADAPAIVKACNDAGMPKLAEALLTEGVTLEAAKKRIEAAKEIGGLVAAARRFNPAIDTKLGDDLVAAGASAEHARAQLFDKIVSMQSPEIAGRHGAAGTTGPNGKAVDHSWDPAVARVNERRKAIYR